jgi:hypothetical protein
LAGSRGNDPGGDDSDDNVQWRWGWRWQLRLAMGMAMVMAMVMAKVKVEGPGGSPKVEKKTRQVKLTTTEIPYDPLGAEKSYNLSLLMTYRREFSAIFEGDLS